MVYSFLKNKRRVLIVMAAFLMCVVFLIGYGLGNRSQLPFLHAQSVELLNNDVFQGYEQWHSSTVKNPNDTSMAWLRLLSLVDPFRNSYIAHSMTDINGDGLPDILFHDDVVGYSKRRYAVLLNKGVGFEVKYRCVVESGVYYGDCAE